MTPRTAPAPSPELSSPLDRDSCGRRESDESSKATAFMSAASMANKSATAKKEEAEKKEDVIVAATDTADTTDAEDDHDPERLSSFASSLSSLSSSPKEEDKLERREQTRNQDRDRGAEMNGEAGEVEEAMCNDRDRDRDRDHDHDHCDGGAMAAAEVSDPAPIDDDDAAGAPSSEHVASVVVDGDDVVTDDDCDFSAANALDDDDDDVRRVLCAPHAPSYHSRSLPSSSSAALEKTAQVDATPRPPLATLTTAPESDSGLGSDSESESSYDSYESYDSSDSSYGSSFDSSTSSSSSSFFESFDEEVDDEHGHGHGGDFARRSGTAPVPTAAAASSSPSSSPSSYSSSYYSSSSFSLRGRENRPTCRKTRNLVIPPSSRPLPHHRCDRANSGIKPTNHHRRRGRRVSFHKVQVRTHELCVGDNPAASTGPPVSLDWAYRPDLDSSMPLDMYELSRPPRRSKRQLAMTRERRERLLREVAGASQDEIRRGEMEAQRARRKREHTKRRLPYQAVEEIWEDMQRMVRGAVSVVAMAASAATDVASRRPGIVNNKATERDELDKDKRRRFTLPSSLSTKTATEYSEAQGAKGWRRSVWLSTQTIRWGTAHAGSCNDSQKGGGNKPSNDVAVDVAVDDDHAKGSKGLKTGGGKRVHDEFFSSATTSTHITPTTTDCSIDLEAAVAGDEQGRDRNLDPASATNSSSSSSSSSNNSRICKRWVHRVKGKRTRAAAAEEEEEEEKGKRGGCVSKPVLLAAFILVALAAAAGLYAAFRSADDRDAVVRVGVRLDAHGKVDALPDVAAAATAATTTTAATTMTTAATVSTEVPQTITTMATTTTAMITTNSTNETSFSGGGGGGGKGGGSATTTTVQDLSPYGAGGERGVPHDNLEYQNGGGGKGDDDERERDGNAKPADTLGMELYGDKAVDAAAASGAAWAESSSVDAAGGGSGSGSGGDNGGGDEENGHGKGNIFDGHKKDDGGIGKEKEEEEEREREGKEDNGEWV